MWQNDFSIFENYKAKNNSQLVYLDNAATSMKVSHVVKLMSHFLENNYGSVHRGAYKLSVESSQMYEEARKQVAMYIGGNVQANQVVFTKGTTESLNMIASGLQKTVLTSNSRIVSTESEHHANLIPWQQAALQSDCEIAYIPLQKDEEFKYNCIATVSSWKLDMQKAESLISANTKVVTIAHVGNALGQVNNVSEVIKLAKRVGAFCVVDCAQSAATHEINFLQEGADAVVFSGHKLFGPTGIGVLAMSPDLMSILPPFQFGGSMVSSVTLEGAEWAEGPAKFEAGTPPAAEAVGLGEAMRWILHAEKSNLLFHAKNLNSMFFNGLSQIPDIEIFVGTQLESVITAFRHKHIHAHDLATILDASHVAVRAGHHCAWPLVQKLKVDALVRASFGPYNSESDVEIALRAIKAASRIIR